MKHETSIEKYLITFRSKEKFILDSTLKTSKGVKSVKIIIDEW